MASGTPRPHCIEELHRLSPLDGELVVCQRKSATKRRSSASVLLVALVLLAAVFACGVYIRRSRDTAGSIAAKTGAQKRIAVVNESSSNLTANVRTEVTEDDDGGGVPMKDREALYLTELGPLLLSPPAVAEDEDLASNSSVTELFGASGRWNGNAERYVFYALAMQYMLQGRHAHFRHQNSSFQEHIREKRSANETTPSTLSDDLNLVLFARLSQATSAVLRSAAREADFYMHRGGAMKTAAGATAVASGILGLVGLLLAPVGGIALTTVAWSLTIASGVASIPSVALDIADSNMNVSPEAIAAAAKNQMLLVKRKGEALSEFLRDTFDAFDELSVALTDEDVEDIEAFLFHREDLLTKYMEAEEYQRAREATAVTTALIKLFRSYLKFKELRQLAAGYKSFSNGIFSYADDVSKSSVDAAKEVKMVKFIKRFFNFNMADKTGCGNVVGVASAWKEVDGQKLLVCLAKDPKNSRKVVRKEIKWKSFQAALKKAVGKANYAKFKVAAKFMFPSKTLKLIKNSKWFKPFLMGVDTVFYVASVAVGVMDVFMGVKMLKGSGSITDRLTEQADNIDGGLVTVLAAYEHLAGVDVGDSLLMPDDAHYLTGLDIHSCNKHYAGSGYGLRASASSYLAYGDKNHTRSSCGTDDLTDFMPIHANEWITYDGAVLGSCAQHKINGSEVTLALTNTGTDAVCLDFYTIRTNHDDAPRLQCRAPEGGVWIADDYGGYDDDPRYVDMADSACRAATGVVQLRLVVADFTTAGTDTQVKARMRFADNATCLTADLDNRGNDMMPGSDNVYLVDKLGSCADLLLMGEDDLIDGDSVWLQLLNGHDALTVDAAEVHLLVLGEMLKFKCDVVGEYRYGYKAESNSDWLEERDLDFGDWLRCGVFRQDFSPRSVFALRPNVVAKKTIGDFETGGGSDDPVLIGLCSGGDCCGTTPLRDLDEGSANAYWGHQLGSCEGFKIVDDEFDVYVDNQGGNAVGLEFLQVYTSRLRMFGSVVTCRMPQEAWRVEYETKGPFRCRIPVDFLVQGLKVGVCDQTYAGTDSGVELRICNGEECCSTGALDTVGEDDLEQGDWMSYGAARLGDCVNFPVTVGAMNASLTNTGGDALCVDRLALRVVGGGATGGASSSVGSELNCYVPNLEEFWVDNGRVDMICD